MKNVTFSTGAQGSKMLQKTKRNQDFRRAQPAHDQYNNTHAPDANHDKGLSKTTKKVEKKHIFEECLRLKSAVKNNTKSRFPFRITKT